MAEPEDLYVVGPNPHIPWGTPTNVFALGRMADFTYLGMEPGQIPMPELDFAPWVIKVLKLVHPNVELSQEGLLTMEDIMHASLAMVVRAAAEVPHTDLKTVEAEHQVQVYSERTVVGTRQYLVHGNDVMFFGDSRAWVSDHEVIDPRVRAAIETWRGLSPENKRERQKDFFARVAKAEEVAGGPEADQTRLNSLTPVCVKAAVGLVLPDELSKHAVSEGTKAVTKGITGGLRNVSEAQQKCALQFGPATVGALAAHLSGCHVTLFAACFLAAVLEYLAAEVMELAGNAARDCQRRFITNRHIFLAISNDAELVALYSTSIFKGGVLPIIHLSLSDAKGIPSAAALLAEGDLNPGADLGEDKAVQDRAMATLLAAPCHESVTADDDRGDGPETHYAHVFADYRAMPDDVTAETERRGFGGLMAEEPLEYAPDVPPSGVSDRPDSMRRDGGSGGEEPFTRHQLRALAAKAGIVAIDIEALNATKDVLMEYVRSRVRAVLTRAEQRCRGGPVAHVDLADLAGSFERLHFGTGRLGKSHKRSLMRPSAAAPHYAFWEKAAAVDRTEGVDFLADYLMTVVDAAEDEGPPEMEGPDEEDPNNFEAQYRRSLRFVRHMQNTCENVIPYRAFASVVSKIARDFKKCFMTPGCICVLSYFTQDFMVRLLQEACLAAIHRKAYVVTEKDVKIASKCHRENATLVSP